MSDEGSPGSEASRLAQVIGLRDWQQISVVELADRVAEGLPLQTAGTVVQLIDPANQALSVDDIVSRSSLRRRQANGRSLTKAQSEMTVSVLLWPSVC